MRQITVAVAVAVCAEIGVSAPASAQQGGHGGHGEHSGHGAVMEMRPSILDGAVLTKPPDRVDFAFTPAMRLTAARLTTATGEIIPVQFDTAAPAATIATVRFAPLAPDSYTLTYTADMSDHTMPGRVRFTVR
jgi:hypothetical protein